MTGPPTTLREPIGRLLTYLVEGELPPAATCTAIADQAEAIRRDNPENAVAIAGMTLCRCVQRVRQKIDAGEEDDTELAMDAIATSISMWATCARVMP